jgi:hypothetical protein
LSKTFVLAGFSDLRGGKNGRSQKRLLTSYGAREKGAEACGPRSGQIFSTMKKDFNIVGQK